MRLLNRFAGRLSRHRRGPLAGLALLIVGLLLAGGVQQAVVSSAQADKTDDVSIMVEKGRELFLVSCSTCHGSNGEGISTLRGNQLGPSLIGVGAAAVDFQVSTGRMPMAQPGAQAPRKAPIFTDEETAQRAAFVASLGPGPAIPDSSDYSLDGLDDDERQEAIVRGGQIFLTNCTACHNYEGAGGAMPHGGVAVPLSGVSERNIFQAMLTGPQTMPSFSNGNLDPEAKRDVIAYLKSLEDMPNHGGMGLGGNGPVGEGMLAWLGGLGLLVGFAIWIAAHTTRTKKKKVEA